jgi:hypothetical protein
MAVRARPMPAMKIARPAARDFFSRERFADASGRR